MFFEPVRGSSVVHCSYVNGAFFIDVHIFCTVVLKAVSEWLGRLLARPGSESVLEQKFAGFATRFPNGLRPYAVGMPLIA